jgi:hypothetical protein
MVYLRFAFEDGAETLEYMAQSMRRKLDLVRVKIGLKGWQAMTRAERLALSHFPSIRTTSARRSCKCGPDSPSRRARKSKRSQRSTRAWGKERVPDAVRARRDISLDAWAALNDEERYVLLRLAERQRMPERFDSARAAARALTYSRGARRHDALLVPAWCSFRCHDSRVAA